MISKKSLGIVAGAKTHYKFIVNKDYQEPVLSVSIEDSPFVSIDEIVEISEVAAGSIKGREGK